jgi:hypothetical protein
MAGACVPYAPPVGVTRSDLDDAGLGPLVADWTRALADGRGFVLVGSVLGRR